MISISFKRYFLHPEKSILKFFITLRRHCNSGSWCLVTVGVLWLFLVEQWLGVQYGIFWSNSKTCLKRPLKNRQNKSLNRKWWLLMKVESIAECSPSECSKGNILQYFWLALSDNRYWKPFFVLYEWPLRTGFNVLTFCTLCWITALFYFRSSGTRHTNWVCHIRNGYTFKGLSMNF